MSSPEVYTLTVEERVAAVEKKVRKLKRQVRKLRGEDREAIGFTVQQDDDDLPTVPDEV